MPDKRSIDPATIEMLEIAEAEGISTAFSRAAEMKPCPIGNKGACCKVCSMGPCRLTKEGQRGICGATKETVAARNLVRMIASGAAAHSDHGRDMALTLLATAEGDAPDYQIRDVPKLLEVAQLLGINTEGLETMEIAKQVAEAALAEFGRQKGEIVYLQRAPKKRQEIWHKLGIAPRGIDREIVTHCPGGRLGGLDALD